MLMEHKQMENQDDDLTLKFKPKSPVAPPFAYKPFESHSLPICPSPTPFTTPATQSSNIQQHHTSSTQMTNLHTTRSIFESKIKSAENAEALQAPRLVSQARPVSSWKQRPQSDIYCDVYLEPGPEPEFCYAPKPKLERKKSLVETLEENIEKQLESEPARIPPGGVRLIPIRREKPATPQPKEKRYSAPVDLRPETPLEPFPYIVTEEAQPRFKPVGPPATPSKFVKGTFSDTNYESDFSDYSYFEKFKHVTPPRPKSTEPNQPRVSQPSTPKYDFTNMPLKRMIQNGSPIPLPSPTNCPTPQKSRPASGYIADTEEQTNNGYHSNTDNRIYNQVGECSKCVDVVFLLIICMLLITFS